MYINSLRDGFFLYYIGKFIVTGKGETGKNEDTYNNQHTEKFYTKQ